MRTGRVESFSDGVFAVAITLLVLDLRAPVTQGSLLGALADEWPAFAAFGISFVIIGVVWVNHHAIFDRLHSVDRPLLFINLGLLMSVVLIPFVTSLFALYAARPGTQADVAAALFNGAQLLMALGFQGCTLWINAHPQLARSAMHPVTVAQRLRFALGVFVYAACLPLSFLSPLGVLILDAVVAAYYVVDQISVRVLE
jgi:TMEM175 potassium channel family protein